MSKKNTSRNKNDTYVYPKPEDPEFQSKLYKKREFYYYKVPQRGILKDYDDIQDYRENACPTGSIEFQPREQQSILPNFLNPNTPYKGIIVIHGVGSGKTISAVLVAEQFKEQAKKYGQKIIVLVPGPSIKEHWKDDILLGTRETYLKDKELLNQMSKYEKERQRRVAINQSQQNYRLMSYMTFYKKVLGEKIAEKKIVGDEIVKSSYKKNEDGEIERELVVDRIQNLDNTILIIDEAHNLTGNEYGLAVKTIKERSKNLRIVLLTGTPMKNLADDIVDLLNFVRPSNKQLKRDKIFTSEKNYMMTFKDTGEEFLRKKAIGYISYYRGSAPYTFANKVDKGKVINELLFTHVVQCFMEDFQLETYKRIEKDLDDSLDRKSSATANFVFPGLDKDKKILTGLFSTDGIAQVLQQLAGDKKKLIDLINKIIFKNKINKDHLNNFIKEGENKNITGFIYQLEYLKYFSIKFYTCIKKLNRLVEGDKGSGTSFIYSNLTKAGGIEVFAECLKQNGYLEFRENPNEYVIDDNTRDVLTGLSFVDFKKKHKNKEFKPATYILVTGSSADNLLDDAQEEKQRIIRETFNSVENIYGEKIKFVLGSKVMTEGITLKNLKELHILDVHYNLGKVDQVIGRGVRMCMHQDVITEKNKFPEVAIYRYVISIKGHLSSDERLYQKGELKYLLVKRVERILREIAIDCPLLYHSNNFPEELEKYKECYPVNEENKKKGLKLCPAICDFQSCETKCYDKSLPYNKKQGTFDKLDKTEIDYGTFNKDLAETEISFIKDKIKDLYRFKSVYSYDEILQQITASLTDHQSKLFEDKFFNFALDEMMPTDENEFNKFSDTVYDKFGRHGYLIQRENYFIFQPFEHDEDVPIFYRENLQVDIDNPVPIKNYIKDKFKEKVTIVKKSDDYDKKKTKKDIYQFDLDYYDKREENNLVGIIDKNINKYSSKTDIFKIRNKRPKVLDKKRGTGIPSLKGAVCSTSKDKIYLLKHIKNLDDTIDIKKIRIKNRDYLCTFIKNKLMFSEKYAISKNKNKITYLIIPCNHPTMLFPFNLEDRIKYIINTIQKNSGIELNYQVKKQQNGTFLGKTDKNLPKYEIIIKDSKSLISSNEFIKKYGGKLVNKEWIVLID